MLQKEYIDQYISSPEVRTFLKKHFFYNNIDYKKNEIHQIDVFLFIDKLINDHQDIIDFDQDPQLLDNMKSSFQHSLADDENPSFLHLPSLEQLTRTTGLLGLFMTFLKESEENIPQISQEQNQLQSLVRYTSFQYQETLEQQEKQLEEHKKSIEIYFDQLYQEKQQALLILFNRKEEQIKNCLQKASLIDKIAFQKIKSQQNEINILQTKIKTLEIENAQLQQSQLSPESDKSPLYLLYPLLDLKCYLNLQTLKDEHILALSLSLIDLVSGLNDRIFFIKVAHEEMVFDYLSFCISVLTQLKHRIQKVSNEPVCIFEQLNRHSQRSEYSLDWLNSIFLQLISKIESEQFVIKLQVLQIVFNIQNSQSLEYFSTTLQSIDFQDYTQQELFISLKGIFILTENLIYLDINQQPEIFSMVLQILLFYQNKKPNDHDFLEQIVSVRNMDYFIECLNYFKNDLQISGLIIQLLKNLTFNCKLEGNLKIKYEASLKNFQKNLRMNSQQQYIEQELSILSDNIIN